MQSSFYCYLVGAMRSEIKALVFMTAFFKVHLHCHVHYVIAKLLECFNILSVFICDVRIHLWCDLWIVSCVFPHVPKIILLFLSFLPPSDSLSLFTGY